MTDTDLRQPGPGLLRAAAEAAELAQAVSGLVRIGGCRLADSDPLAPLARDIARSMTEAGLTVHHCARHDPLYRPGGVCLLAVPAGSGTGHGGIAVSWTAHNLLLLDWDRYGTYTGTQQAMNTALGGVLRAFGPQRRVTWPADQPRTTAGRRRTTAVPVSGSLLLTGLMPDQGT